MLEYDVPSGWTSNEDGDSVTVRHEDDTGMYMVVISRSELSGSEAQEVAGSTSALAAAAGQTMTAIAARGDVTGFAYLTSPTVVTIADGTKAGAASARASVGEATYLFQVRYVCADDAVYAVLAMAPERSGESVGMLLDSLAVKGA